MLRRRARAPSPPGHFTSRRLHQPLPAETADFRFSHRRARDVAAVPNGRRTLLLYPDLLGFKVSGYGLKPYGHGLVFAMRSFWRSQARLATISVRAKLLQCISPVPNRTTAQPFASGPLSASHTAWLA